MIKRFKSKGLVGILDCDITFNDEKIILITGPNGSGKTSLLKQITHPLSSHDRINRLKNGVEEAETQMEIDFYGNEYKIIHIYTRTKTSPKVLSYLWKKVNNDWVNLVENGLPTNFKSMVEKEFDYYDHLFPVLNIGSHNRGMIDMTNNERLEYLKKITKEDILSKIKENVNSKYTEYNANGKYISNEISKIGDLDELIRRMEILNNESIRLTQERDNLMKKKAKLSGENLDTTELEIELKNKKESIRVIKSVYDELKKFDDINKSYNDIIGELEKENVGIDTKLEYIGNDILKINEELLTIENSDVNIDGKDDLLKRKEKIEEEIKDNKFPDISEDELKYLLDVIEKLPKLLDSIERTDRFKKYLIHGIDNDKNKIHKEIIKCENNITDYQHKLDELSFSKNLLNLSVPDDCKITTCQLRLEHEQQMEKYNIQNTYKNEIQKYREKYDKLNEEYSIRIDDNVILSSFYTILGDKDRFIRNINEYGNFRIEDFIEKKIVSDFNIILNNNLFHLKSLRDLESINKELSRINMIEEAISKGYLDRKIKLNEEISKLEIEEKDLSAQRGIIANKIKMLQRLDITDDLKSVSVKDLDHMYEKMYSKIPELETEINTIQNKEKELILLDEEIKKKNVEMKENTEAFFDCKNESKRISNLEKEFTDIQNHLIKLKSLRDIVSKSLPAKIMDSYLYDVSKLVNYLLEDIMNVRFDTSEGVEIICNIRGEERPANVLSQGERSMLSVALLIAFKKSLKWDIISIDEGSAALDEFNKDRFINLVTKFIESIDTIGQVFIVSHDIVVADGMDMKILRMGEL